MHQKILKSISSGNIEDLTANNLLINAIEDRIFCSDDIGKVFDPFDSLIAKEGSIAIALSGGADSMALCLLTSKWAKSKNYRLVALIVDHGLREETIAEVEQVKKWLSVLRIGHQTLCWKGPKPIRGIQSAARIARYRLITRWCREHNYPILMTGHQLEDQIETFLLRARNGSGLDGLAPMREAIKMEGILLLRPLLRISKFDLRRFLAKKKQLWIEDTSNQNIAFERTKMRWLVDELRTRNLGPERILSVLNKLDDLRRRFYDVVNVFFDSAVTLHPEGYGVVQLSILKSLPVPIIERVITRLLSELNGNTYPARRRGINMAVTHIISDKMACFTLGGCRFIQIGLSMIICRELRSIYKREVKAGESFVWDNLYKVTINGTEGSKGFIHALGETGWAKIKKNYVRTNQLRSLPYCVKITLPTLSDNTGIVEVPSLNYRSDNQKELQFTVKKIRA